MSDEPAVAVTKEIAKALLDAWQAAGKRPSQSELARRIGCTPSAVNQILHRTVASSTYVYALARELNVTLTSVPMTPRLHALMALGDEAISTLSTEKFEDLLKKIRRIVDGEKAQKELDPPAEDTD